MNPSPLVVSCGLGVNSIGMLAGMVEKGERPDAIAFSDTRGEKPETYGIRQVLQEWLARVGFPPLTTLCRADKLKLDESLEAECLRLGTLPSRAYGFGSCADKWKIDPFRWWVRDTYGRQVIRCLGFDAGESQRAKEHKEKWFTARYPLIEWGWDRDQCIAAIRRAGLPIPPKSACFYCPSSKKRGVLWLNKTHPPLMARALVLEAAGVANADSVRGLGRTFSWRALIAADHAQQKLFPEAPVEDCLVCADGGPDKESA